MSTTGSWKKEGAGHNPEHRRLTGLYERWTRWSVQPLGRAGWETVIEELFGSLVLLIGIGFSIAFTPFDLGLWIPRIEPHDLGLWALESDPRIEAFFQSLPAASLAVVLGVLFVVNGWIVDRSLHLWDPSGGLPWRIRALRFLIGGVPVLGLSVLPLWTSWRRRGSSLQTPVDPKPAPFPPYPATARLGRVLDRVARHFMSVKKLGVLFLANCAVVFAAGSKLAFPAEPSPERTRVLIALGLALHVLAWLNMTYWLGALARRFSGARSGGRKGWVRPLLWLFPVPYMAAFGAIGLLVREWRLNRPQTLTYTAFEKGKGKPQGSAWARLEATLREAWRSEPWWRRALERPQTLEASQPRPRAEEEVLRLCRRKSLALGFEAALLAFGLDAIARTLEIEATLHMLFVGVLLVSSSAAGLGLLRTLWRFLELWARAGEGSGRPDRGTAVSVFVTGQLAWAAGWIVGLHLCHGNVEGLGATLVVTAIVGLALQAGPVFLRLLVSVPFPVLREARREAPWLLLFVAFLVCGSTMAKGEAAGPLYALLLLVVACLAPLWGAAVGGWSLRWLLRPHRLGDLAGGRLSGKRRLVLLGLIVTVLVPFGGLVSPLWILTRGSYGHDPQVPSHGYRY